MKNIVIAFFLIVFCKCVVAQNKSIGLNCKDFKKGIFYYPQMPDYGYTIREKKVQKSYVKAKDIWVTWNIIWIDACSFELTYKEATKSDGTFGDGDKISVTITKIDGDCYSFLSVFYNKKNPQGLKMPEGSMCKKTN